MVLYVQCVYMCNVMGMMDLMMTIMSMMDITIMSLPYSVVAVPFLLACSRLLFPYGSKCPRHLLPNRKSQHLIRFQAFAIPFLFVLLSSHPTRPLVRPFLHITSPPFHIHRRSLPMLSKVFCILQPVDLFFSYPNKPKDNEMHNWMLCILTFHVQQSTMRHRNPV